MFYVMRCAQPHDAVRITHNERMIHLGVNIDHVATLRQARQSTEPDPAKAAAACETAGAHNITVHLREDRRHIQLKDVEILRKTVRWKLNLEMANIPEMVKIALKIKPDQATLVPEKRQELTTEGGLNTVKHLKSLSQTLQRLKNQGIDSGLFIEPSEVQVRAACQAGASFVEFHTGRFANAKNPKGQKRELSLLKQTARQAHDLGMKVHAGHGLNYCNVHHMMKIPYLEEVNIGHAIVSRAVFVGLEKAVREMLKLISKHRSPDL